MNRQKLRAAIKEFKNEYNYNDLEVSMMLCGIARDYNPFIQKDNEVKKMSEVENKTCFEVLN